MGVEPVGGGWNWNHCLNLQQHGNRNRGEVNVWSCSTHHDQKWRLENMGGGWMRIRNRGFPNRCLNMQAQDAQKAHARTCGSAPTTPTKQWRLG